MAYKSGMFNFPTGGGSHAVTGLGFRPQGVVMIGGNKATVGSLLTGLNGPGLFISMSARDWTNPAAILSVAISPKGHSEANTIGYRGIETGPISMPQDTTDAANVDYKAGGITFDADGFTLTISTPASGVRPIHWFAWGGDIDAAGTPIPMQTACVKQQFAASSPTFDAGFRAFSSMVLSTVAANGFGEGSVNDSCWFSFGTSNFPEFAGFDAKRWRASVVYTQLQLSSPLGRQGFTNYFVTSAPSFGDWITLNVSDVLGSLGPLLTEGFRRFRPYAEGGDLQVMINEGGASGLGGWQDCIWWNSEGWSDTVTIPAGGSVTVPVPENFSEFEQIMFSTVNGGNPGAKETSYGVGMLGYDDQGCVVFQKDGSFYQSNSECVAHCDAGGYSAASGVINGNSFTLTHTHGSSLTVVWHAWGKPSAGWLPQMYRWWSGGKRLSKRS